MTANTERTIIQIDSDLCNGCGACVDACHEGAIQMVDGKAKLVSDVYCDGLGDCLGPCPTGAITLIKRPAEAYDAEAVARRQAEAAANKEEETLPCGCPGTMARTLKPAEPKPPEPEETLACGCPGTMSRTLKPAASRCEDEGGEEEDECGCGCGCDEEKATAASSELINWPVQLKLVPPAAPYLKNADWLLAADCTAVAVPDFHNRYLKNRPVVIACPKLDDNEPQIAKLATMIQTAQPRSITVLRMEVPCCGGLARVAAEAVKRSGAEVPVRIVIVGTDGREAEACDHAAKG